MGRLDGTVTVVTGAASGIGAACSERFATEGGQVVTIDAVGEVDHQLDVRDEGAVRDAFDQVLSSEGRLDAVVHAAGVAGGGPVHLLDAEEWDRVVNVNLKGTFLIGKYSALAMLPAGRGSIVNIASIEGIEGSEGGSAYNASKGGVVTLTKCMAIDYGRRGLRVNCICPGGIDTPMLHSICDPPRDGALPGETARRTPARALRPTVGDRRRGSVPSFRRRVLRDRSCARGRRWLHGRAPGRSARPDRVVRVGTGRPAPLPPSAEAAGVSRAATGGDVAPVTEGAEGAQGMETKEPM